MQYSDIHLLINDKFINNLELIFVLTIELLFSPDEYRIDKWKTFRLSYNILPCSVMSHEYIYLYIY